MTADLSREEIEWLAADWADFKVRVLHPFPLHEFANEQRSLNERIWRAAPALLQHALSEPTRLAQARAEGYREGIEAAAQHHDELAAAHEAIVRALDYEDESARISAMAGKEHRGYAAAIRALAADLEGKTDGL